MNTIFGMADSCVYLPVDRTPVGLAMHRLGEQGAAMRMSEEEYRSGGFREVPEESVRSLEEMVYEASAPVLRRAAERGAKVKAILFASVTTDAAAGSLFARLLREFSLEDVPVVRLAEYGCATFHLSLRLAKAYFAGAAGEDDAVLFVTADKARGARDRSDTYMLFGDAASAASFRNSPAVSHRELASGLKADGIAYDLCPERVRLYFSTFYLSVRQLVRQVLREAGASMNDIALIFCTNLGLGTWSILAKVLGCPLELFYADTLAGEGHLHNTDIVMNIEEAAASGRLRKGDLYLAVSVGFGGYYGCSLHQFG